MIAAARVLEPSPMVSFSRTMIRPARRSARWYAVLKPVTPAPMMRRVESDTLMLLRIVEARVGQLLLLHMDGVLFLPTSVKKRKGWWWWWGPRLPKPGMVVTSGELSLTLSVPPAPPERESVPSPPQMVSLPVSEPVMVSSP